MGCGDWEQLLNFLLLSIRWYSTHRTISTTFQIPDPMYVLSTTYYSS